MNRLSIGVLRFLPAAILLLTAAPTWATPGPLDETFVERYPLRAGSTVTLQNVNGSVRIEGWAKNEVEVNAVKHSTKERRDLDRVRIEVETPPGAVNIHTRYPENDPAGVSVEYRVKVPYQLLASRVETVNGNIVVTGVEGAGELRTVNGNVDVYDSAGCFNGRVTNGDVHVELRSLANAGAMSLESVNGSVLLALPQTAGAQLDVQSMNGEFRTELPIALKGAFGREYRGNLGRGGMLVRLRTINGRIEIVTLRATI
jgi:DUF4097 and DUF4098 domain-containing protein YvlB